MDNSKFNIIYITRKFPPSVGGMEIFNKHLIDNLKKNIDVHLIVWRGIQSLVPFFMIVAFIKSLHLAASKKINLIHVSDGALAPLGLLLKITLRKKVTVTIHGLDITYSKMGYKTIISRCCRSLDHIFCVSLNTAHITARQGIMPEKITVVPNGIEFQENERISKNDFIKTYGIPNNAKILLTVGRLIKRKGVNHFIQKCFPDILSRNPGAIYLIIGEGPERSAITKIINHNNFEKNIFLLGNIPLSHLACAYRSSDIFIMPNISIRNDVEGFGIVALEAASNGLPVIASNVDGIPDAVKDNMNGFLISKENYINGFSQKITDILNLSEYERNNLRSRVKEFTLNNFSWSVIGKAYADHFKKLTHG